jgi:hypothetical protein
VRVIATPSILVALLLTALLLTAANFRKIAVFRQPVAEYGPPP